MRDVARMNKLGVTLGVMDIVTGLDVAVAGEAQARDDVRIQVTTSPLFNVELIYLLLLLPESAPLTCHWYDGLVPPFVITAEKVSSDPLHGLLVLRLTVIVGVWFATVIVSELDVAVVVDAHGALDVMTHVTTAPLVSVLEVNVALLVPALVPFTFH